MWTLLLHGFDAHRACGSRSVQDFIVGRTEAKSAFRGGSIRTIIDILRSGKALADGLELRGQMRLVDSVGKRLRIAEQQPLILVQLEVREKSNIRAQVEALLR